MHVDEPIDRHRNKQGKDTHELYLVGSKHGEKIMFGVRSVEGIITHHFVITLPGNIRLINCEAIIYNQVITGELVNAFQFSFNNVAQARLICAVGNNKHCQLLAEVSVIPCFEADDYLGKKL